LDIISERSKKDIAEAIQEQNTCDESVAFSQQENLKARELFDER
jgi:hypothetical protein